MGWYKTEPMQAGEARLMPNMSAAVVKLQENLPMGVDENYFSFPPRPMLPVMQPRVRQSVLVLVLDSASRPTVRTLAPRFYAAFQGPRSIMFPRFHSVSSE